MGAHSGVNMFKNGLKEIYPEMYAVNEEEEKGISNLLRYKEGAISVAMGIG
jgi:hypothetical protein